MKIKTSKKQLGQFFTTNSEYILQNLDKYVVKKNICDPFAGKGDLIFWAKKHGVKSIRGFDISPDCIDNQTVFFHDGLLTPQKYDFVLTNPPYLNINKADSKTKEKYFCQDNLEDLYQLSLKAIYNSNEGIVIVPINFLSAENSKRIRSYFFSKFEIVEMNYFTQRVFADTTYNVIAFYYRRKKDLFQNKFSIKTHIYPENKIMKINLEQKYHWTIGGELTYVFKDQKNSLGIYRLTEKDLELKKDGIRISAAFNHVAQKKEITISQASFKIVENNIILLKAIDSGSEGGKIALENIKSKYGLECLISKESSRHMIYLIFPSKINIEEQNRIIEIFNSEINQWRKEGLSLFLTNYRDKNRKRISFDFVYKMINYIYFNQIKENNPLFN